MRARKIGASAALMFSFNMLWVGLVMAHERDGETPVFGSKQTVSQSLIIKGPNDTSLECRSDCSEWHRSKSWSSEAIFTESPTTPTPDSAELGSDMPQIPGTCVFVSAYTELLLCHKVMPRPQPPQRCPSYSRTIESVVHEIIDAHIPEYCDVTSFRPYFHEGSTTTITVPEKKEDRFPRPYDVLTNLSVMFTNNVAEFSVEGPSWLTLIVISGSHYLAGDIPEIGAPTTYNAQITASNRHGKARIEFTINSTVGDIREQGL